MSVERDHSKVKRSVLRSAYTWCVKFVLEIENHPKGKITCQLDLLIHRSVRCEI